MISQAHQHEAELTEEEVSAILKRAKESGKLIELKVEGERKAQTRTLVFRIINEQNTP